MVVSLHLGATRVGGLSASAPTKATGEIPARWPGAPMAASPGRVYRLTASDPVVKDQDLLMTPLYHT